MSPFVFLVFFFNFFTILFVCLKKVLSFSYYKFIWYKSHSLHIQHVPIKMLYMCKDCCCFFIIFNFICSFSFFLSICIFFYLFIFDKVSSSTLVKKTPFTVSVSFTRAEPNLTSETHQPEPLPKQVLRVYRLY